MRLRQVFRQILNPWKRIIGELKRGATGKVTIFPDLKMEKIGPGHGQSHNVEGGSTTRSPRGFFCRLHFGTAFVFLPGKESDHAIFSR